MTALFLVICDIICPTVAIPFTSLKKINLAVTLGINERWYKINVSDHQMNKKKEK